MTNRNSYSSPIEKSTDTDSTESPKTVDLGIWKEALEVVDADACFGVHSRPIDVYNSVVELDKLNKESS